MDRIIYWMKKHTKFVEKRRKPTVEKTSTLAVFDWFKRKIEMKWMIEKEK